MLVTQHLLNSFSNYEKSVSYSNETVG